MPAHDPKREELYHVAGDAPDPTGTGLSGRMSSMRLTQIALGHPLIRYKDRVIEADVYEIHGRLMVHLICPRCLNALKITDDRKKMEYSVTENRISIEAFGCTWEMNDDRRMEFGVGLCRWRVGVTNNVARDA
jgi:hypothetical protein